MKAKKEHFINKDIKKKPFDIFRIVFNFLIQIVDIFWQNKLLIVTVNIVHRTRQKLQKHIINK